MANVRPLQARRQNLFLLKKRMKHLNIVGNSLCLMKKYKSIFPGVLQPLIPAPLACIKLLHHIGNLVLFEIVPGGHLGGAFFSDFVGKSSSGGFCFPVTPVT